MVAIDKDGKLYDGTVNQKKKCEYYLLKFDSSSNSDRDHKDPKGMTKIEYIYSLIAANCGINMPQTSFIENEEDFHFLIKRFDRIDKEGSVAKIDCIMFHGQEWHTLIEIVLEHIVMSN